ncbi:MAG TPA: DUF6072 family protein [Edaphobacter sp.]|jgi:hypothetical protein|nr:DUF6072 family protein [Edaphobacter sp.]
MPRELPEDPVLDKPLQTGLAFCGEYLVPGGSHLVQGDLKGAAIHGALGFAASMLFGFPARLLFSANSLRTALGRRPVVAPKTEAVGTPAAEAAREVPKPAVAVTKPPSPPAPRSPSLRKTVVKTRSKAAAPKPAAATTRKRTGVRSRKSTS